VRGSELAPIVAFELNLVGPVNSDSTILSSGAGKIGYTLSTPDSAVPPWLRSQARSQGLRQSSGAAGTGIYVDKRHENGARRSHRGPIPLVAGTVPRSSPLGESVAPNRYGPNNAEPEIITRRARNLSASARWQKTPTTQKRPTCAGAVQFQPRICVGAGRPCSAQLLRGEVVAVNRRVAGPDDQRV
jgi:hypothetical protein